MKRIGIGYAIIDKKSDIESFLYSFDIDAGGNTYLGKDKTWMFNRMKRLLAKRGLTLYKTGEHLNILYLPRDSRYVALEDIQDMKTTFLKKLNHIETIVKPSYNDVIILVPVGN